MHGYEANGKKAREREAKEEDEERKTGKNTWNKISECISVCVNISTFPVSLQVSSLFSTNDMRAAKVLMMKMSCV